MIHKIFIEKNCYNND